VRIGDGWQNKRRGKTAAFRSEILVLAGIVPQPLSGRWRLAGI